MKRMLSCVLVAILVIGVLPICGNASEVETICFEDGSYATVEVVCYGTRASGSVTGNKNYSYYDRNSVKQWKATLTGSFTYTGSSSTCTSSDINVTIYNSDWYVYSKSASKSGNTASGSATVAEKLLGVTITTVPVSLTLKCDANGNLS